jgi:hypothetical protein
MSLDCYAGLFGLKMSSRFALACIAASGFAGKKHVTACKSLLTPHYRIPDLTS